MKSNGVKHLQFCLIVCALFTVEICSIWLVEEWRIIHVNQFVIWNAERRMCSSFVHWICVCECACKTITYHSRHTMLTFAVQHLLLLHSLVNNVLCAILLGVAINVPIYLTVLRFVNTRSATKPKMVMECFVLLNSSVHGRPYWAQILRAFFNPKTFIEIKVLFGELFSDWLSGV